MAETEGSSGVLVIEDDLVVRDLLRACLVSIDQDVYLAADGVEALDLAARMHPALVMCDISLPAMNGLEICQRLRQMPQYRATPIVVLTQHREERIQEAAMKAGATAFLNKPLRPSNILSAVAQFLPIKPELLAKITRDNERAAFIANKPADPSALQTRAAASVAAPNNLDRGKKLLSILRG